MPLLSSLSLKGLKGNYPSILTTTILAIAVGLVDLSSIDFANNHVGAAFEDLKTVFGAALGSEGLGALISDTARFCRNSDGHSCLLIDRYFDTIEKFRSGARKRQTTHKRIESR